MSSACEETEKTHVTHMCHHPVIEKNHPSKVRNQCATPRTGIQVSGWKFVTIVSKLVCFTYLRDVFTTYLYRGEIIH